MSRYAPDLGRDRFYLLLTTYHWVPLTVLGFALLAVGGWRCQWGIFCASWRRHATWLVNSAPTSGAPPLRHEGRFKNSLVGGAADLRRGLATTTINAHPVSARHAWHGTNSTDLARTEVQAGARPRLGVQAAGASQAPARRNRRRSLAARSPLRSTANRLAVAYDVGSRRRSIAFFIVLGLSHRGGRPLNISWVTSTGARRPSHSRRPDLPRHHHRRRVNTIFLVREIRRNEQHDAFIHA